MFTEKVGKIIFDKGIVKEIADFALMYSDDYDLLNDTATIFFAVFDSFTTQFQTMRFFHSISEFKLLKKIMTTNNKSEVVCTKTLELIINLFINSNALRISKQEFTRLFVKSGGVEAINGILREQMKSGDVVKLCVQIFILFPFEHGKAQARSSKFICFILSVTIDVKERIDAITLEKAFDLHGDIFVTLGIAQRSCGSENKNSK